MNISRFFLAYMMLVGIAAGALLVTVPQAGDFWIKPYFWILIAIALFDGGIMLSGRAVVVALTMNMRAIGFAIGALLVIAITMLAGSPAHLF
jgi:hypothetical protein